MNSSLRTQFGQTPISHPRVHQWLVGKEVGLFERCTWREGRYISLTNISMVLKKNHAKLIFFISLLTLDFKFQKVFNFKNVYSNKMYNQLKLDVDKHEYGENSFFFFSLESKLHKILFI